jgi:rhodanese-related sulfurtransferase
MRQKMIIDVRTPAEFKAGHLPGSINIPLQEFQKRWKEIPMSEDPVVLCCASGNRSKIATQFLRKQGVTCENGGSWSDVEHRMKQEKRISNVG